MGDCYARPTAGTLAEPWARLLASRIWAGFALTVILATSARAAEVDIKFSLDSKFEGPSAPFIVPLDKGYYKAEGVNLSIEIAASPLEPITRLTTGYFDMGFVDINALIKARDAKPDLPIKAIFMVYNRPPYAIIGRKSRGITKPKDLEGKKLGAPNADLSFAKWPILAQLTGIDVSLVTIENVGAAVREPMLAAGQVDAITGRSFASFIDLKDQGVPADDISVLLMSNYGVELYGNAIVVNTKFAADHPAAVKGFLRAFLKGLKETVRTPATAIDSVLRRNDQSKKDIELERLTMAIRDNIATAEVKANGYGGIDATRFSAALDQIGLIYKFKSEKPKLDDIFEAGYLPAERKF